MLSWEEGRTINFEMAEAALDMALNGTKQAGGDQHEPELPHIRRTRPECGAIMAMLELATNVKAFSVGKPSLVILRTACMELGLTTDQTIVIGDTMETDILGSVQLGCRSVLVLSGGTSREDLPDFAYRPDKIVASIADLKRNKMIQEFSLLTAVQLDGFRTSSHSRATDRTAWNDSRCQRFNAICGVTTSRVIELVSMTRWNYLLRSLLFYKSEVDYTVILGGNTDLLLKWLTESLL